MRHKCSINADLGLRSGDHVCCLYENEQQRAEVIIPFISQGIAAGERVLYLGEPGSMAALRGELDPLLAGTGTATNDPLVVISRDRMGISRKHFEPEMVLNLLEREIRRAASAGYRSLRVVSEMSWILEAVSSATLLIEYESRLDEFLQLNPVSTICLYDRKHFDADLLMGALHCHPLVMVDNEALRNVYYVPSEELLSPKRTELMIERSLDSLRTIRRAELIQKDNEARYRELVAVSPNAVMLVKDGAIASMNRSATKLFGADSEGELTGRSLVDLVEAGSLEDTQQCFRLVEEGQVIPPREMVIRRLDGGSVITESAAMPLELGGVHYALVVSTDVTLERRMAEELRNSESRFRAVVELAPSMVMIHQDGCFTYLNPAALEKFGAGSLGELIGAPFRARFPARYRDGALGEGDGSAADERVTAVIEQRLLRLDGVPFDVELAAIPLSFGSQRLNLVVAHDITERKRAEKEIRRLNEELERLIAVRTVEYERTDRELVDFCYAISHELRAPVARLQGFSEALREECADCKEEQSKFFMERIEVASLQLQKVIESILTLSRLSRVELKNEEVNLSGVARQVVTTLLDVHPERQVEFVIAPDVTATGDPLLLSICLENLLVNAHKYTSRSGSARIEFGTGWQRGGVAHYVRDNGVGFDMAYADQLFVPFQRLHRQEEYAGTGIGLAIVQRIVERHGGSVWAEAIEGEGATFWFTLR